MHDCVMCAWGLYLTYEELKRGGFRSMLYLTYEELKLNLHRSTGYLINYLLYLTYEELKRVSNV